MDRFFRLWAPAAALGLIVGCAGEEGVETPPPATPPTPAPTPAPDATPAPPPVQEAPGTDQAPELTPAESHQAEEAHHPAGTEAPPADEPKAEEAKPAGEPDADEPLTPPQADEPQVEAAPSLEGPDDNASTQLSEEEIAEIKNLPTEDQELALAQAVCPVSGENLGSMDTPLKVSAEGRDFFICCKGCEKAVDKDPKSVVAKLDEK